MDYTFTEEDIRREAERIYRMKVLAKDKYADDSIGNWHEAERNLMRLEDAQRG